MSRVVCVAASIVLAAPSFAWSADAPSAGRILVFPVMVEGAVTARVQEDCSNIFFFAVRGNRPEDVVTVEDVSTALGFSPVQAAQLCEEDDVLCFSLIGHTVAVQAMAFAFVRRDAAQGYTAVIMVVDVERSTITQRTRIEVPGDGADFIAAFKESVSHFFGMDPPDAPAELPPPPGGDAAPAPVPTSALPPPAREDPPEAEPAKQPLPTAPALLGAGFRDPDAPIEEPTSWRAVSGWSSLGAGAIAAGIGVWQGMEALDAQRAFVDATTLPDALDARQRGETAGMSANIALVGAVGLVVTAAMLLLLDMLDDEANGGAVVARRDE